jgi:hypothetical protein
MAHGPEVVRDNMGHANIDVTQNVYGKSGWEERVKAVTRAVNAVDAVSVASQNSEEDQANERLKRLQPSATRIGCPCGCPSKKAKSQIVG